LRKQYHGQLFVLPAFILLVVLMIYPLFQTLLYSVADVEITGRVTNFAGFSHFHRVLERYDFSRVMINTLLWVIATVGFEFTLALGVALFLNIEFRGRTFVQVVALIPWTIPSVVAGNTWRWIFQTDFGLANSLLTQLGLGSLAQPWLSHPGFAYFSVVFASIWRGYPFLMIMLLSGLKAIPHEQFEAAMIDGASSFQRFRYITVPNLKNIIVIVLILQVIYAWNTFDVIFVITGGGPGGATEVLGLFIYRLAFSIFNFSEAAAVSVMLLTLVFVLGAFRQLLVRREGVQ
jgi:ABC-type sugar transport system permease subunit